MTSVLQSLISEDLSIPISDSAATLPWSRARCMLPVALAHLYFQRRLSWGPSVSLPIAYATFMSIVAGENMMRKQRSHESE